MCVISMVHDHYWKRFPDPVSNPDQDLADFLKQQQDAAAYAELAKLIAEFREAIEAAKKVDILTKQPDCIDPEKAKLQERVNELEQKLAEIGAVIGK